MAKFVAAFCLDTRAKKLKYIIFRFLEWESNPQPIFAGAAAAFEVARLCPCATTGLNLSAYIHICIYIFRLCDKRVRMIDNTMLEMQL